MPTSILSQSIKENHENGTGAPLQRTVTNSYVSTSPTDSFHHPRKSFSVEGTSPTLRRSITSGAPVKTLKPFREQDIKILLLENVNTTGVEILKEQGYQVETLKSSLPEDQLVEKIK
jgi:D-3-phosphoglycerate dehydrogenase / 2-oxoglutarate reductase